MDKGEVSRRQFLIQTCAGISSVWLAANWPGILAAQEHARHAANSGLPVEFKFFSRAQAAEVEAIAAQIIPTDETPGAREARVIYFIDRALKTFDREKQKLYVEGLELLQSKLKELFPGATKFSAAGVEQQISVLKAIEKSAFFGTVRAHTVMGFLADPQRGGNQGQVGWKLIGFDDQHVFEPPFGSYDRDYPGWEASMRGDGERRTVFRSIRK